MSRNARNFACLFAFLGVALGMPSSAAARYVEVDSFTTNSRQTIAISTSGVASGGMDLRLFEFRQRLEPIEHLPDDRRLLVIKNMNGEIDESLPDNCRFGRASGSRVRQNDYSIVQCLTDTTEQINLEGTDDADLVCTIDPTESEFRIVYDVHTNDGDDAITGGDADDELNGGEGVDLVRGSKGPDHLFGTDFPDGRNEDFPMERDRDYVWGESGDDLIFGGPADDLLVGGTGRDVICGADADHSVPTPDGRSRMPVGCTDWDERDTSNTIFSSEARELDLDTGLPLPAPAEGDDVDCGGAGFVHKTQYSNFIDNLSDCPSAANPKPEPPQYALPYKTPAQAASVQGVRACPPIK